MSSRFPRLNYKRPGASRAARLAELGREEFLAKERENEAPPESPCPVLDGDFGYREFCHTLDGKMATPREVLKAVSQNQAETPRKGNNADAVSDSDSSLFDSPPRKILKDYGIENSRGPIARRALVWPTPAPASEGLSMLSAYYDSDSQQSCTGLSENTKAIDQNNNNASFFCNTSGVEQIDVPRKIVSTSIPDDDSTQPLSSDSPCNSSAANVNSNMSSLMFSDEFLDFSDGHTGTTTFPSLPISLAQAPSLNNMEHNMPGMKATQAVSKENPPCHSQSGVESSSELVDSQSSVSPSLSLVSSINFSFHEEPQAMSGAVSLNSSGSQSVESSVSITFVGETASNEQLTAVFDALDPLNGDAVVLPLEADVLLGPDILLEEEAEKNQEAIPKPRRSNPGRWKKNLAKKKSAGGLPHVSMRGKVKEARKMGKGCTSSCIRKCHTSVSEAQRQDIFNDFWKIEDHTMQWYFISNCVKDEEIKRRTATVLHRATPYRKFSYGYYLPIDGILKQVCQRMFLQTLGVGEKRVRTMLEKRRRNNGSIPMDGRGRNKKLPQDSIKIRNDVVSFIKRFPTVEAHYCRKDIKARYLPENLNRRKLWTLYKIEKEAEEALRQAAEDAQGPLQEGETMLESAGSNTEQKKKKTIASLRLFRDIFRKEFNLKFFRPKKDQCAKCLSWKNKTGQEKTEALLKIYEKHLQDKKISQDLKASDIDSIKEKPDETKCVLTCDLEKVFLCPKGENSEFYYKSKLSVYNFTIYVSGEQKGFCFVWDQTEAGRGSAEIASCLWYFIKMKVEKGVKEFIIYSDNCSGQNKNQFLFSMYVMASIRLDIKICHRYLETGHTHMEADSVHATIQNSIKHQEIFIPSEWYTAIKLAKKVLPRYEVVQMKQADIFDFKPLALMQTWDALRTSKFKEICVDGSKPGMVFFKNEYSEESSATSVLKRIPGRPPNWKTLPLKRRYSAKIPLKKHELKDLQSLCSSGAIPSKYHPYYMETLPSFQEQAQEPPPPHEVEEVEDEPDVPDEDTESEGDENESEEEGDLDSEL